MYFYRLKNIFQCKIEYILMYLKQIFPLKLSELKISISVKSYDEKTDDNYRNCYVTEMRIVLKLSKISIPNFNLTN